MLTPDAAGGGSISQGNVVPSTKMLPAVWSRSPGKGHAPVVPCSKRLVTCSPGRPCGVCLYGGILWNKKSKGSLTCSATFTKWVQYACGFF